MNKVKHAYGRMFRSETDKSKVYLLDKRFCKNIHSNYIDEELLIL